MNWAEKLPWQPKGLPSFIGLYTVLGLMEAMRSAFFWVYLPFSARELGLTLGLIGGAWIVHSLTEAFSRGLGGYLVQRLGIGVVGILAGAAGLLTVVMVTQNPNPWTLMAGSFLWGLLISALLPGYVTLSSRIAVPGREGRALAYTHFLLMPWVGLGWVLGTFFMRNFPGSTYLFLYSGLILAMVLALINFRVKEPIPKQPINLRQLLPIFIVVPVVFAQTFVQTLFNLIILKFTLTQLMLTEWQLYLAIGLAAAVTFVGAGILGRIPDKKGPHLPLMGSLLVLATVFVFIAQKPSYLPFVLLCMLGGLGFATFVPSWNAFVLRLLPTDNRAAIWGSLMMIEGLGAATGPAVGGLLWDWFGPSGPFLGGAVICLMLITFYGLAFWRFRWNISS